jgi:hypothetical protein
VQDTIEGSASIRFGSPFGVDLQFGARELTLSIPEFRRKLFLDEAMAAIGHEVDRQLFSLYRSVWQIAGTPGSTVDTFAKFDAAAERLNLGAVPMNDRFAALTPSDTHPLVRTLTQSPADEQAARDALRRGQVGNLNNIPTYMSQTLTTHQVGAYAGTPVVSGAGQAVTYLSVRNTMAQNLATSGWTATTSRLNAGDVFTLANVFQVNPRTKVSTGVLQQFVVNTDVVADGSGLKSISISPPIITTGPYQNVTAAPANNAAITVVGAANSVGRVNLVMQKQAFTLIGRQLEPLDVPFQAYANDEATGLSVRISGAGDITNNKNIKRLDVLLASAALRPEYAVRLGG